MLLVIWKILRGLILLKMCWILLEEFTVSFLTLRTSLRIQICEVKALGSDMKHSLDGAGLLDGQFINDLHCKSNVTIFQKNWDQVRCVWIWAWCLLKCSQLLTRQLWSYRIFISHPDFVWTPKEDFKECNSNDLND